MGIKIPLQKKLVSRDDGPSTALNIDILILRKNISFVGWRINWVKGLDGLRKLKQTKKTDFISLLFFPF